MEYNMNIKKCPFCDGNANIETTDSTINGPGHTYVVCTQCKASVPAGIECLWLDSKDSIKIESAINRWNRRV